MGSSPVKMSFFRKKGLLLDLAGILLLSLLLHIFTLSWELPHIVSPEVDGIPPTPGLTAEQMCRYETHKYPILQYIIAEKSANLLLSPLPEGVKFSYDSTNERVWKAAGNRVLLYRSLSALMGTLAALLLYLMVRGFLGVSRPGAFLAAGMLLLPPAVLHYSHTTNMDMPALFWMTALLFSLLYWGKKEKEGAEKKVLLPLAFLSGVLLGCAFATKDQIYAVTILPFFYFVYRMIREKKSFIPTILSWGGGFLFTVFFIYFVLCRDKEIFFLHFKWLVTSGSDAATYALVSKSIMGYLWLFGRTLWDMASAMDGVFTLFLLGMGGYLLYRKYKKQPIPEWGGRELLIFTALAFFSHFFFFSFVVRYNYPRYMLPLLPLFALLGGVFFDLLYKEKKRIALSLLLLFFLLAAVQSIEYLFLLSNTPRMQARQNIGELQKMGRLFTSLSRRDKTLSRDKKSLEILSRHTIRDWSYPLALKRENILDLPPEGVHLYLFEPDLILAETFPMEKFPFMKKIETYRGGRLFSLQIRLFSVGFPQLSLYGRSATLPEKELLAAFQKEPLSWQLVLLQNGFGKRPVVSLKKARNIGLALAPFAENEVKEKEYAVNRAGLLLAADLYRLAGRKEDERKIRQFLRK